MELYIGGMAQGKKAYVLQERGIAKEEIWDDFEVWFREELQVTISLGDACRPGCLADATDVCQIEEGNSCRASGDCNHM